MVYTQSKEYNSVQYKVQVKPVSVGITCPHLTITHVNNTKDVNPCIEHQLQERQTTQSKTNNPIILFVLFM